jgi:peptidyl-prolyl cis-trans isomerase SurA
MTQQAVSRYRCLRAVALVLTLAFTVPSLPHAHAAGKSEIIERIVAVVNGEALLLSELRKRAAPFLPRLLQAPEMQRMTLMTQLYEELLTQLIDERLLEQESRKLTIAVSSTDVERAIDNLRRQSGVDDKAFWAAVEGQGFSPEQYKSDVRRHLLRLKVVNQKVRSRINFTEEDVRRKYDQMLRAARASSRFLVAHIMLPFEEGSATKLAEVKARADALRATLTPQNFDAAMSEHGGGELGWVEQKDMPESLSGALLDLEPGQISPAVRGPAGVHIFLLRERQEGEKTIAPYDQMKNDVYREMIDQAMAKQEVAYLEELRKQSLISRRL